MFLVNILLTLPQLFLLQSLLFGVDGFVPMQRSNRLIRSQILSITKGKPLFSSNTVKPAYIENMHMENIVKLSPSSTDSPLYRSSPITLRINTLNIAAGLAIATSMIIMIAKWIDNLLWTPTRTYNKEENSVGREYDAWSSEGILEHYWGEHIHLGYYGNGERNSHELLPPPKNFIQAKYDFVEEMLKFSGFNKDPSKESIRVLDVGCGIGGTSRYLAKKFGPTAKVTGITLSPVQVARASELAAEQNVHNVNFQVTDALKLSESFPENSFDLVWACESGEHMPDKKKYVEEMTRVLKPGGKIVIATWCQRDTDALDMPLDDIDSNAEKGKQSYQSVSDKEARPFTAQEQRMLHFLYAEWTHPFFISIRDYAKLMAETHQLKHIKTQDWTRETIASWLHSIWVGVFDPWPVMKRPGLWWKTFRDGLTLYRMHVAFRDGLMQYGMMTATKEDVKSDQEVSN